MKLRYYIAERIALWLIDQILNDQSRLRHLAQEVTDYLNSRALETRNKFDDKLVVFISILLQTKVKSDDGNNARLLDVL